MSHILVATDFSEVAENAIHYACQMAKDHQASVTVLHSFIIPVTFSDTPMPVMPVDEGREIAEDRMNQILDELRRQYPELAIGSKIMFGDIVDCIEEYAEEQKPWLVVLGNSGTEDSNLWLGSNVVSALKNLKQTVIAVPKEAQYKKAEKICFACDFKNIVEHFKIQNLVNLIQSMGGQLHVLNVDHNNKELKTDAIPEHTGLHEGLLSLNPVYHYVEKENVNEAIQEFIEENHMDWLIIVPHKYSFFEGLFHKSHTKAMVKVTHIPIVALHEE